VLTENARLKHPKLFRSIPNAPYTPLINAISINYEAESSINLEQITSSNERMFKERLFHIHPFGVESISPLVYRNISLLPRYDEAGNLFIGLSASQLSGTLTLLYHLREDCAPEAGEQPTEAVWYYLSSNRWIAMASSDVISDTTNGFLSTGIVTLNIPDDVHIGNTVMPDDMFWLRVSVEKNPQYLCSLYSVHAQALQVTWQPPGTDAALSHGKLPAGTIKEPRVSIAGIGKINQIIDSFGGSPPESADRVKTRISERLRHKNRTLLSWDYERLILERFPDLRMVKCFPNMQSNPETPTRPGHILIVVVPEPKEQPVVHMRPMVNGLVISEISEFARKLSSPFAIIEVRNPAYEQVQVRCTVKFTREATGGHYINLLNQAISDYVSPWNASVGYGAKFGWSIRRYDIESFIRGLEYVEFVTNFSMLHIADDDSGYYHLFDTVHGRREEDEVRPLFPWSIAVPTRRHFVETTDHLVTIQAEQTGIDELRIGSTFIITDVNDNGTEE
jgi:hypothetical protein